MYFDNMRNPPPPFTSSNHMLYVVANMRIKLSFLQSSLKFQHSPYRKTVKPSPCSLACLPHFDVRLKPPTQPWTGTGNSLADTHARTRLQQFISRIYIISELYLFISLVDPSFTSSQPGSWRLLFRSITSNNGTEEEEETG